jgi:hypothetical protein
LLAFIYEEQIRIFLGHLEIRTIFNFIDWRKFEHIGESSTFVGITLGRYPVQRPLMPEGRFFKIDLYEL